MRRILAVAALLVFCCLSARAQTGFTERGTVINGIGQPVAGASIYVCTGAVTVNFTLVPPCSPEATIYSDYAMTQPITQPLASTGLGNYVYYVAAGTYTEVIVGNGILGQSTVLTFNNGSATPAGSTTNIQLNNAGALGAIAGFGPDSISSPTTLQVPFSSSIKGPSPWADITQNGARAVALNDTVTGSGSTITVTSTAWKNGDGIAIGPGGSSSTLATPAAPTVSTGEDATDTTPDALLAAGATGSSTYNYCVFAIDKLGHATVCSPTTTITNGPATLGPRQFTLSNVSLTGSTLTYVTTAANGLLAAAKVHITGLNANTLYLNGWFPVTTVTNATTDATSGTPAYSASTVSATSGTLTYFVGNKVTWSAISGAWEYGVCAERPGDVAYHIAGYSLPVVSSGLGNPLQFVDWGSTFGGVAPFWTISDANCTNASPTNAIYSGTVTGGGGTTTLSISPALSNPVTNATAHQDSTPGIIAAADTALSSGYSAVFIPPDFTAYQIYSPLSFPPNVKVLASGNLFVYAPVFMTNADVWQTFGKGSQLAPQFAYVGGATIACAISPCLQTGYSGTSGSYQNIDRLTVNAPRNGIACVIDNGTVSQGDDYYGLNCVTAGGSSDNAGMPVYFTGGLTSFRFSAFTAGGASDTTWTPGFYNAGGGPITFEHVHWALRGYLVNNSADATSRLNVADMYRQGGIEPYIEFDNTEAGLDIVGANITHVDGDTEVQPTVTLMPVTQSIVGSIVLGMSVAGSNPPTWRVTGGYEEAGAFTIPCPEIAQYGPPSFTDTASISVCSGALNASLPVTAPAVNNVQYPTTYTNAGLQACINAAQAAGAAGICDATGMPPGSYSITASLTNNAKTIRLLLGCGVTLTSSTVPVFAFAPPAATNAPGIDIEGCPIDRWNPPDGLSTNVGTTIQQAGSSHVSTFGTSNNELISSTIRNIIWDATGNSATDPSVFFAGARYLDAEHMYFKGFNNKYAFCVSLLGSGTCASGTGGAGLGAQNMYLDDFHDDGGAIMRIEGVGPGQMVTQLRMEGIHLGGANANGGAIQLSNVVGVDGHQITNDNIGTAEPGFTFANTVSNVNWSTVDAESVAASGTCTAFNFGSGITNVIIAGLTFSGGGCTRTVYSGTAPTGGWISGVSLPAPFNNSVTFFSSLLSAVNAVAYSATPTVDLSKGNVQQFACTTAGASITPTFSNLAKGEQFTVVFVQNGTTACTWTWPSNIHGATAVSSTLSSISTQQFVVSNNGTDAYAIDVGTSATGGTP